MPRTLARFGLTGKTVPPNGLLIRFQRSVRPTLPAFSDAPITAMLFGAKMASSGCCCLYRKPALGVTLSRERSTDVPPVLLVSIRLDILSSSDQYHGEICGQTEHHSDTHPENRPCEKDATYVGNGRISRGYLAPVVRNMSECF